MTGIHRRTTRALRQLAAPYVLVALWAAPLASARAEAPRQLVARRVAGGSIHVDGRGDDPGWRGVKRYGGFVQRDPREGEEPSEQTRVKIAYDDEALYVFVEALDQQPDSIRGLLTRRDAGSASDWIEVWLDPHNDRRTGYRFAVNARGVKLDSRLSEGGQAQDAAWDGVWTVRTERTDEGWAAEYRIPFSQIRYSPRSQSWGIQVVRRLQRKNEQSVLSPTPRTAARPLRYLARLSGLRDLPPPRRLDLVPYGVLSYEREPRRYELLFRPGIDARVGLGAASTLHLTLNPDFGQVEADPSVLNLTAFETFFAERRQFFLDGKEVFNYPLAFQNYYGESLYYSRRIGARPSRDLGLEDEQIRQYPSETTIIGAGKLVGRSSGGLSYGWLEAVTARERARVVVDGSESEPMVAPLTSYTVARLRKELDQGHSVVGVMGTHVSRQLDATVRDAFVEHATAGGIDFDLRAGHMGVVGKVLGTQLSGTAAAIDAVQTSSTHYMQRPDADHLDYDPTRTSLAGWGLGLVGGKLGGRPWRAAWGGRMRSPGLNPNDLGYLRRADAQHAFFWVRRIQGEPTPLYRLFSVDYSAWLDKTFGSEITGWGSSLSSWWHFSNNMTAWLGAARRQEALDVSLLRGGPAFLRPGGWETWGGVFSDNRKPWELGFYGSAGHRDERSNVWAGGTLFGRVRPTSAVALSLEPRWVRSFDELQFVNGDDPQNIILGRLLRDTVSVTARVSWGIALGFTLEAYAMPFVSAGTYDRFYRVADPQADEFRDRIEPWVYDGDDRFLYAQIRSNVVLRYDYAPGSRAYLVWFHEQSDDRSDVGTVVPRRDGTELLGSPATDVVMLKLEHYLSL